MKKSRSIVVNSYSSGRNFSLKLTPEQALIQIHRFRESINFEANNEALKNLSAEAFVLYMYLVKQHPKYLWRLAEKDVLRKTPLTSDTLKSAFEELVEKQYLTPGEVGEGIPWSQLYTYNSYHLWEKPSLNPNYSLS